MPAKAKLYIGFAIALGAVLLAACLLSPWQVADPQRYESYLLLAAIASILKIRLPKFHGTISLNFLFILIGVAELTLAETVLLGCVGAAIQCVWTKKKPALVRVAFNMSALVTSIVAAYTV